jgi:hypothetical protein
MLFAVAAGATGAATYAIVTVGLGRPPEFVGVLTSVMGVGAIAGGFLATRIITGLGELGAVGIGWPGFPSPSTPSPTQRSWSR